MKRARLCLVTLITALIPSVAAAGYVKGVSATYPFSTASIVYRIDSPDLPPLEATAWYQTTPAGSYFHVEQYELYAGGRELVRIIEGDPHGVTIEDVAAGTSYTGPYLEPWQIDPYLNGDLPSALRGSLVGTAYYQGRRCDILEVTGRSFSYRFWLWGPIPLRVEIHPLQGGYAPAVTVSASVLSIDISLPTLWITPRSGPIRRYIVVPPPPVVPPPGFYRGQGPQYPDRYPGKPPYPYRSPYYRGYRPK